MPDFDEEDEIICKCFQVKESTIRSCIAQGNITAIEDVTSTCEAGGNCQTCHILIQLFIDQHQQKIALEKNSEPASSGTVASKKGFLSRLFAGDWSYLLLKICFQASGGDKPLKGNKHALRKQAFRSLYI